MNLKNIILSPYYCLQIFTGAKSFEKNPILASLWLNKRGLHVKRVQWAQRMANWRRKRLSNLISEDQRNQYEKNGFICVENFLTKDVFEAVKADLKQGSFNRHDMLQGSAITRRVSLDDVDLKNHPALASAKNDERISNLLRYVSSHGGQPLLTLQIVFALPAQKNRKGTTDPQTVLHSDTFHPTAKCWLFLNDVGEDDGPFSYVKSSHKMTPQRYVWEQSISENNKNLGNKYSARGSFRISSNELDAIGYAKPTKMTVKANTLVVADTHGFHARCASPNSTTRIEIYGSLRRNPFIPYLGFHIASLPGIRNSTNKLAIYGLATLEKLGVRKSPWKEEGNGVVNQWPERLKNLTK